jgi:molybdenum cofactor cytidylyltransferase
MGERRSHPVIFNRSMYKELSSLKGDTGGRELFVRYKNDVCLVEPVEGYIDLDIDTPEDYNAYLDFLNKK